MQRGGAEQEKGSSLGDSYPYPFTSEVFENSLKEVPAGARLAIRTCLQHWREKVSGGNPSPLHIPVATGKTAGQ